jgi:hypothetical protein
MRTRWSLFPVIAAAVLSPPLWATTVTDGALDLPVGAAVRLTFHCQHSASGTCYNTLVGESGWVAQRFSVPVGQKRVLYDVSESLKLCMTDAPVGDASQCEARPLSVLLAPLKRD